ncbi:MAG: hypothetical protein AAF984_10015 [Verrucomicrobiota bacterium]
MTKEHLLARLHLRALLPTLAELVRIDESAQKIIENWNFTVRFTSATGISTTLQFKKGTLFVDPERRFYFPLNLMFASDKQVNNLFTKQDRAVPIPIWGLQYLPAMLHFQKLTNRLENILKASVKDLQSDEDLLRKHVRLLMGRVIPAAVAQLGTYEAESQAILKSKVGMIQIEVKDESIKSWIQCSTIGRNGDSRPSLRSGFGAAPTAPDFIMSFRDLPTALLSINNELDTMAAATGCDISIRGSLPLGEAVSMIMERVALYLKN